jgi:hypothetical protein
LNSYFRDSGPSARSISVGSVKVPLLLLPAVVDAFYHSRSQPFTLRSSVKSSSYAMLGLSSMR